MKKLLLVMAGLWISVCTSGIQLLGLDVFMSEKTVKVNKDQYAKLTSQYLIEARDAALQTLAQVESKKSWQLTEMTVGLGLEGKVGLGNLYAIDAHPRVRLHFIKGDQP